MRYLDLKISNNITSISLPEKWNELNQFQLLYIAERWQAWQMLLKADQSMQKAKALLFIQLIQGKTYKELKKICNILSVYDHEANDINLLGLTDFVFEKNALTENLIPEINIGWFKKLYGPAERLKNITINEFSYTINYFNVYNSTGDEKYLDLLICCLYRQSAKGSLERGDIREPFNPNTADRFIKRIAKLPYSYKQAIYLFFYGCLEHFLKLFPLVFERKQEVNSKTNKTFIHIVLNVSGGKFGTFDQTKETLAMIFLEELNHMLSVKPKKEK